MDNINILLNKLEHVNKTDFDYMDTIGSEIRLQRNRMNLTLKALTDNTCSISYLSKIEHNQIEPNMGILKELCDRLKITESQFNELLNTVKVGESMIKYYYLGNEEEMKKIYDANIDLKNVSSRIIVAYYYLYHNQIKEFEQIYDRINKAISVLNDRDTINFGLLYSIYLYKTYKYDSAKKVLQGIGRVSSDEYYNALKDEIYSQILFDLDSDEFYIIMPEVIKRNLNLHLYDKLRVNKYLEQKFRFNRKVIEVIKTAPVLNKDYQQRLLNVMNVGMVELNDSIIYKLVKLYYENKEEYLNYVKSNDISYNNIFESCLIKFLVLKATHYDQSVQFLMNECIPLAFTRYNYLYSAIFIKLLQLHYTDNTRYKRYLELEDQFESHFIDLR